MQVSHIMIVVFMGLIQHHGKIHAGDPFFDHTALFHCKTGHRKPGKRFRKLCKICSKVQKSGDSHIAADSRIAFQIKTFPHSTPFPRLNRAILRSCFPSDSRQDPGTHKKSPDFSVYQKCAPGSPAQGSCQIPPDRSQSVPDYREHVPGLC